MNLELPYTKNQNTIEFDRIDIAPSYLLFSDMWDTKLSRSTEYQDLDKMYTEYGNMGNMGNMGHHGPRLRSRSGTSQVLTVLVTVLCLTSIIGVIAMTYRSTFIITSYSALQCSISASEINYFGIFSLTIFNIKNSRSFMEPDIIIIPLNKLHQDTDDTLYTADDKMTPVVEMTQAGGWGRHRLGKLPPPNTPDPKWDPEPSDSDLGLFDYAAISVDSIPCATIGK